jgi:hypothetical protein
MPFTPVIGSLLMFRKAEHMILSSSFENPDPLLATFLPLAGILDLDVTAFSSVVIWVTKSSWPLSC